MSEPKRLYSIRVFCKRSITRPMELLKDFFSDRVFFDDEPEFIENETKLGIYYIENRKPIWISLLSKGDSYLEKKCEEIRFVLNASKFATYSNTRGNARNRIYQELSETINLLLIEFQREEFESDDDGIWEFLDIFEGYVATQFDGIIHTDDQVFYDKNLKKFYKL